MMQEKRDVNGRAIRRIGPLRIHHFVILLVSAALPAFQGCGVGFESAGKLTSSSLASEGQGIFTKGCSTSGAPARAPLRLLSKSEHDYIMADVFGLTGSVLDEAKLDPVPAGTNGFSNTAISSDEGSSPISALMVEKYYSAAQLIASKVLAVKDQSGSFYRRVASCAITAGAISETCYDSVVRQGALLVWRRPVVETGANSEMARLKALLKGSSTFDKGFSAFVRALTISPNFLFQSLTSDKAFAAGQVFELDGYQMASRLSFFLWQSAPDLELYEAASSGALESESGLRSQVARMLKDARSKRLARVLSKEWIEADKVLTLGLTSIDANTINSMVRETELMFEDIIANDGSFLNVINANYSFMNKALADYYGVTHGGGDANAFVKTSLLSTPRRGVLNHASFLISTAGSPTQPHPVLRGKLTSRKFGCFEVAPPPAGLDVTPPKDLPANATPKEMLVEHTKRASCAGCHSVLDPFGLPLESFDGLGRWRTTYASLGNRPIDASGKLPTGETFNTTEQFMNVMANSPNVRACMVRNLMAVGLARKVASSDDLCVSSKITETDMQPNSRFSELIAKIVLSRQFRLQTVEAK